MEHNTEGVLCGLLISPKFAFYLEGTKCTSYCNLKPLALFFTTCRSSLILDRWALELQQFNIKFQHMQGKKNVVADTVSQLRMLGLFQDIDNEDIPTSTEDVVENIIEEIHSTEVIQRMPAFNIDKLTLDVL